MGEPMRTQWCYKTPHSAAVEDPFDATDNCARTISFTRIDGVVEAFGHAAAVMNAVRDNAGDSRPSLPPNNLPFHNVLTF